MQHILLTGGTGFVGRALSKKLIAEGFRVTVLTRNPDRYKSTDVLQYAAWNPSAGTVDTRALASADAIINLAGAGVMDKRWNDAYKSEILNSRIQSIQVLADALAKQAHQVKHFIGSSAIGWYGPDQPGHGPFTETDPAATDYLGDTCRQWEAAADPLAKMGIRVCLLRTGIVLGLGAGALEEFQKPLRMGVAAILGSGRQMVSWIHLDDLCDMFLFCLKNTSCTGSLNAVAPLPVSNKTLTLSLARHLNGSRYIPMHVPAFMLRLMLGEQSIEILKSATVSAEKMKSLGFEFRFPDIDAAMKDLCSP